MHSSGQLLLGALLAKPRASAWPLAEIMIFLVWGEEVAE